MPQFNSLVWSDEFDYTGLPSPDKWSYDEGGGGWGNNELQYYTKNRTENARVENGNLIIEARRESFGGRDYTSARLVSRSKGDWLYGRIEARAKLQGGKGTWSAIWMLPTDWVYGNWPASGEIDIMEHVGYDPLTAFGTVHTEAYNHKLGTQKGSSVNLQDLESAFHVYAIEWTPDKMDFFVDDLKYFTFVNEGTWQKWPFDKRFHLLMNIAVGGTWGGAQGIDPNAFPQQMVIDYVRVYQKSDLKITGPEYLETGQSATYTATHYNDAAYDWTVPGDARILSGQGTREMTVQWGTDEGEIIVDVTIPANTLQSSIYIKRAIFPADPVFQFGDFTNGDVSDLSSIASDGSTYDFSESADGLKIIYKTVSPNTWPRFELTLPRPVNLKNHPWCFVNLKTFNKSNSVTIRFDFADINGYETNATPVFRPLPIVADGQFHFYSRNFTGRWLSSTPYGQKVDSTRIIRLTTYINGGIFGIANKTDSLWIESIRFQTSATAATEDIRKQDSRVRIYPNPAKEFVMIKADLTISNIQIYSTKGFLIKEMQGLSSDHATVDLSDLPGGMYLILVRKENGGVFTERFVK